MKHITIYILFAITATIILLNRYTALYINNSILHFILLFIAAASFIISIGHLFGKLKSNRSILFTFLIVGILCMLKSYLTWSGDWKTQTIIYSNKENPKKTIEYQMQPNRFGFGYKKRIVERYKIVPFIDWTTDNDTLTVDTTLWKKTEKNTNELQLKPEL